MEDPGSTRVGDKGLVVQVDEKAKYLLDRLAISTETLFGYAYAGILMTIVVAIAHPEWVRQILTDLGTVLSLACVLALGSGVFVLCHRVLGPLALYRGTHWAHERYRPESSSMAYLGRVGVDKPRRREAYDAIKDRLLPNHLGTISHSHGEIQFLYVAVVVSLVGTSVLASAGDKAWIACAVVGLLSYVCAVVTDARQHALETRFLRANQDEVTAFLQKNGFIRTRVEHDRSPLTGAATALVIAGLLISAIRERPRRQQRTAR